MQAKQGSGVFTCITSNTSDMTPYQKLKNTDVPVIFFDIVPDDEDVIKFVLQMLLQQPLQQIPYYEKKEKNTGTYLATQSLSITKKREDAFKKAIDKNIATNSSACR